MAKLTPRKLTVEDFPEQSWIGKLLSPLNDFFSQVYLGWNNGLSIEDNLHQEVRDVKVIMNATTFPMKIKTKFNSFPKGVTVIHCQDSSGGSPTTAPWVTWGYSNGQLEIRDISGLTLGKVYTVRLHIIYS